VAGRDGGALSAASERPRLNLAPRTRPLYSSDGRPWDQSDAAFDRKGSLGRSSLQPHGSSPSGAATPYSDNEHPVQTKDKVSARSSEADVSLLSVQRTASLVDANRADTFRDTLTIHHSERSPSQLEPPPVAPPAVEDAVKVSSEGSQPVSISQEAAKEEHDVDAGVHEREQSVWLYKDLQGIVQGPFTRQEMAAWQEAGYLSSDLPVKTISENTFQPLTFHLPAILSHMMPNESDETVAHYAFQSTMSTSNGPEATDPMFGSIIAEGKQEVAASETVATRYGHKTGEMTSISGSAASTKAGAGYHEVEDGHEPDVGRYEHVKAVEDLLQSFEHEHSEMGDFGLPLSQHQQAFAPLVSTRPPAAFSGSWGSLPAQMQLDTMSEALARAHLGQAGAVTSHGSLESPAFGGGLAPVTNSIGNLVSGVGRVSSPADAFAAVGAGPSLFYQPQLHTSSSPSPPSLSGPPNVLPKSAEVLVAGSAPGISPYVPWRTDVQAPVPLSSPMSLPSAPAPSVSTGAHMASPSQPAMFRYAPNLVQLNGSRIDGSVPHGPPGFHSTAGMQLLSSPMPLGPGPPAPSYASSGQDIPSQHLQSHFAWTTTQTQHPLQPPQRYIPPAAGSFVPTSADMNPAVALWFDSSPSSMSGPPVSAPLSLPQQQYAHIPSSVGPPPVYDPMNLRQMQMLGPQAWNMQLSFPPTSMAQAHAHAPPPPPPAPSFSHPHETSLVNEEDVRMLLTPTAAASSALPTYKEPQGQEEEKGSRQPQEVQNTAPKDERERENALAEYGAQIPLQDAKANFNQASLFISPDEVVPSSGVPVSSQMPPSQHPSHRNVDTSFTPVPVKSKGKKGKSSASASSKTPPSAHLSVELPQDVAVPVAPNDRTLEEDIKAGIQKPAPQRMEFSMSDAIEAASGETVVKRTSSGKAPWRTSPAAAGAVPIKSLAEIQAEELEEARRRKEQEAILASMEPQASSSNTPESGSGVPWGAAVLSSPSPEKQKQKHAVSLIEIQRQEELIRAQHHSNAPAPAPPPPKRSTTWGSFAWESGPAPALAPAPPPAPAQAPPSPDAQPLLPATATTTSPSPALAPAPTPAITSPASSKPPRSQSKETSKSKSSSSSSAHVSSPTATSTSTSTPNPAPSPSTTTTAPQPPASSSAAKSTAPAKPTPAAVKRTKSTPISLSALLSPSPSPSSTPTPSPWGSSPTPAATATATASTHAHESAAALSLKQIQDEELRAKQSQARATTGAEVSASASQKRPVPAGTGAKSTPNVAPVWEQASRSSKAAARPIAVANPAAFPPLAANSHSHSVGNSKTSKVAKPAPAPAAGPPAADEDDEGMFWDEQDASPPLRLGPMPPAPTTANPQPSFVESTSRAKRKEKEKEAGPSQSSREGASHTAAMASPSSSSSLSTSVFGGPPVPPGFAEWCASQLAAITGSDDTTLAHFLLSLSSESEIRDYIREYLGSSAQVSDFANNFVRRRSKSSTAAASASPSLSASASSKQSGGGSVAAVHGTVDEVPRGGGGGEELTGRGGRVSGGGKKKKQGKKLDASFLSFSVQNTERILKGEIETNF